jgi:hypothetical protein
LRDGPPCDGLVEPPFDVEPRFKVEPVCEEEPVLEEEPVFEPELFAVLDWFVVVDADDPDLEDLDPAGSRCLRSGIVPPATTAVIATCCAPRAALGEASG